MTHKIMELIQSDFTDTQVLINFVEPVGEIKAHANIQSATASVGFEYEHESQRSFTESMSEYGTSYGKSKNHRENRAYFVALTNSHSHLSYNLGGRLEDNERFGNNQSWQAGASWAPLGTTNTLLKAAAGTAIKEPTSMRILPLALQKEIQTLSPKRQRLGNWG